MTRLTLLLSFLLLISIPNKIEAQTSISNAKITFEFISKKVKGTISGFKSNSRIDFSNIENSILEGSVASKTLDTNNGLRNWSLKSGKYFDADDFPRITFKSSSIAENENDYTVKGTLTLKSTSKPVTIMFTKKGNQFKGTFEIYSSDFGIKIKKKREDNLVKVTLLFDLKSS